MDDSIWIAIIGQNLRQILDQSTKAFHLAQQQQASVATCISAAKIGPNFSSTKASKFKCKLVTFCHYEVFCHFLCKRLDSNRFPKRLRYFFAPMAHFSG